MDTDNIMVISGARGYGMSVGGRGCGRVDGCGKKQQNKTH